MNRFLILLLLVFSFVLHAEDAQKSSVSKKELENAMAELQGDSSLAQEDKDRLIDSLKRTLALTSSAEGFTQKAASFEEARKTASAKAVELQTQLEASIATAETALDPDIELSALESSIQADKAELARANTTLDDVTNKLKFESNRANDIRQRQGEIKKAQAARADQGTPVESAANSYDESARKWQRQAEVAADTAELQMLAVELLSQPMRLELLKARQDLTTQQISVLRSRIQAGELYVSELRKGEAEKALSQAETAEQQAEGKHPLILALAARNTELSSHGAELADLQQAAQSSEVEARDEASKFEADLKTIERKLEIVGMSKAMGQVLRDQQMRLPSRQFSDKSESLREEQISASSLRQFEYEEERRRLRDISTYVRQLTDNLPAEEAASIEGDLKELATARRELLTTVIDAESAFLRTLGELDFTARRLTASADAYRDFISERLLWIRTSAPLSLSTFQVIPSELALIFAPRQWIDIAVQLPTKLFDNLLSPLMMLIFILLFRLRPRMLKALHATGDKVGNVEGDGMRYSYQALGLSLLLALQWPFLLLSLGVAISHMPEQTEASAALANALTTVCYYFFGLELFRVLVNNDGLAKRHFLWSVSTLQPLERRLRSLQRVFVPCVIVAIISGNFYHNEGDSVVSMFAVITAQAALALFFARLPPFMEAKLDHLLANRRGARRNLWGKLVRQLLVLLPCALIVTMLLGYGATAIQFLVLLLLTISLFAVLLIAHEFGIRWLRLIRARLIKQEREAALAAAAEHDEEDGPEAFTEPAYEEDPNALDNDGRKLLTAVLGLGAVFGVWAVWVDVMPALGIFNSIQLWSYHKIVDGKDMLVPLTLADMGVAFLVGFVGYVATKRLPALLEVILRQKMEMSPGSVYAIATLLRYSMIMLVVISVLGILGGSWSQIQWAVAALSVGIGFGLQEIVANFISGLILLFEQPIRVGDTVTVGETSGVVTRIRMRATTIRDWDRRELLVPNKEFITGRLLNWSLSDQITRFTIVIGVAYGTNLKNAMELALEAAAEHPDVLEDPAPFITFDEFGDNSLQIVLRCFMASVDKRLTASSQVRMAVNDKFNEAGIVVAFPQQDVHLNTAVPLEINLRKSGEDGLPA